ncbi:hypothetical protein GLYMA_02G116750v4 [Glycine max]|nr:hypothetical protein GLYMA_02G116750v4 [Glycine max]KAH1059914.1 hypothetical protein GYH30_003747 [Glycine max]
MLAHQMLNLFFLVGLSHLVFTIKQASCIFSSFKSSNVMFFQHWQNMGNRNLKGYGPFS